MKLRVLKPMTRERAGDLLHRLDDSCAKNATRGETRAALLRICQQAEVVDSLTEQLGNVRGLAIRLKRLLKDRNARLSLVAYLLTDELGGVNINDCRRAANLREKDWKLCV